MPTLQRRRSYGLKKTIIMKLIAEKTYEDNTTNIQSYMTIKTEKGQKYRDIMHEQTNFCNLLQESVKDNQTIRTEFYTILQDDEYGTIGEEQITTEKYPINRINEYIKQATQIIEIDVENHPRTTIERIQEKYFNIKINLENLENETNNN